MASENNPTSRITGKEQPGLAREDWGHTLWFSGVSGIETPVPSATRTRRPFHNHGLPWSSTREATREDRTLGPYYQWTFKREGKTVTVNLSAGQADLFRNALANNRELEGILKEMRELSMQICEAKTEGVKRRKPREIRGKRLS